MKTLTLPSGLLLMFEEDIHAYRIGTDWDSGEPVPGSHEFMERMEIVEPMNDAMLPWVERGQRVHKGTELHDLYRFFPNSPPAPEYLAWRASPEGKYLTGWINFLDRHPEFVVNWHGDVEALVGELSEYYWLSTIVDRRYDDFRILQIKTGQPAKYHPVQLAIEGLLAFPGASQFERWAVYLADDGSWTLKKYDDDESLSVALRALKARCEVRKYLTTRRKPVRAFSQGSPA